MGGGREEGYLAFLQVSEYLDFRSATDKLCSMWQVIISLNLNFPLIYKLNLCSRNITMIKLDGVGDIILPMIKPYII